MHESVTAEGARIAREPHPSLRVLHLVGVGPGTAAVEREVRAMREGLEERGHDVRVMVTDVAADGHHPLGDLTIPRAGGPPPLRAARRLWHHQAFMDVGGLLRTFRPEVVHLHTLDGLGAAALAAVRGVPTVLSVHDPGQAAALRGPALRRGLRRVRRVLVPSRFVAGALGRPFAADRVHVLVPGVELPARVPPPDDRMVLFVGDLDAASGVEVLMHAALPLLDDGRVESLVVMGDGPERARLERMAAISGQSRRITLLGRRSRTEMLREMARAAVLAVPSTVPVAAPPGALEALGVGRPIVATRLGVLPELVEDRRSGRLVEPGDAAGLADALIWVLGDDARRESLSLRAAAGAARFGIARSAADLEGHYAAVTGP